MAPAFTATPASRILVKPPSPFRDCSSVNPFRYNNAFLERSTSICRVHKDRIDVSYKQRKSFPQISACSMLAFPGNHGHLSSKLHMVPQQHRNTVRTHASNDNPFGIRIPKTIDKPEWWLRTLSCVPYLIAIQMSDAVFYLQPLLENHEYLENLIFYIPGAVKRFPTWFPMLYYYFAYMGVVKNKDLPLFLRFHVIMGMLLETALQVVWHTSNFMPLIHYNGSLGMYYWAGVGFAFIFVLLQCIKSALSGVFAKIPVVSESAFIHALFRIGGFQRPF